MPRWNNSYNDCINVGPYEITPQDITRWNSKQDLLMAGDNIAIVGNTISAKVDLSPVSDALNSKQDKLIAGDNITISENVISAITGYVKPAYGIPKADLSSSVQASLNKADTALQSYTEQYTGTVTGIKLNGTIKGTSGVVDLGTVLTEHQSLDSKQDVLTAGDNITIVGNVISATGTGGSTEEVVDARTSATGAEYESLGKRLDSMESSATAGINLALDSVQGVASNVADKMDSANPTGTGSFKMNGGNATGTNSVCFGNNTASGSDSMAMGYANSARNSYSVVEGFCNLTSGSNQHVMGKYNRYDWKEDYALLVGNGTGLTAAQRSNALELDWSGNLTVRGAIQGSLPSVAPMYDASVTYDVGDYCYHVTDVGLIVRHKLYRCILSCTGIAPTDTTHWVEVTVGTELAKISSSSSSSGGASGVTPSTDYNGLDPDAVPTKVGMLYTGIALYKFTFYIPGGLTNTSYTIPGGTYQFLDNATGILGGIAWEDGSYRRSTPLHITCSNKNVIINYVSTSIGHATHNLHYIIYFIAPEL